MQSHRLKSQELASSTEFFRLVIKNEQEVVHKHFYLYNHYSL